MPYKNISDHEAKVFPTGSSCAGRTVAHGCLSSEQGNGGFDSSRRPMAACTSTHTLVRTSLRGMRAVPSTGCAHNRSSGEVLDRNSPRRPFFLGFSSFGFIAQDAFLRSKLTIRYFPEQMLNGRSQARVHPDPLCSPPFVLETDFPKGAAHLWKKDGCVQTRAEHPGPTGCHLYSPYGR